MPPDEEPVEPQVPEEALRTLMQEILENAPRSEHEDRDLLKKLRMTFEDLLAGSQAGLLYQTAIAKQLHRVKLVTTFMNGCPTFERAVEFDWLVCGALDIDGEDAAQFIKDAWALQGS